MGAGEGGGRWGRSVGHKHNIVHCIGHLSTFFTMFNFKIQLFRERWSENVHATITKCIVADFELTVLQGNVKEWLERPSMYVCEC